jgi:tRNA G18 (ribose-2'-O)-methylase SpoU
MGIKMNRPWDMIRITTLEIPELQPYRTLRRSMDHQKQGIFVAEGEKVVRRLLLSTLPVVSMLMSPERVDQILAADQRSQQDRIPVYVADRELLETIVGYRLHQAIMAVGRIPAERPLAEAIGNFRRPHLLVALDGIVSAENVGIVVRNCAAFGVDGIVVGENSSSPYLRRAVRNSMGAVFRLPVFTVRDLAETLAIVSQDFGTQIVAAHPSGDTPIGDADLSGNVCIVFGSEGAGISSRVLEICTLRVTIRMMQDTDSLNVSNAAAIFLYEARRSRQ